VAAVRKSPSEKSELAILFRCYPAEVVQEKFERVCRITIRYRFGGKILMRRRMVGRTLVRTAATTAVVVGTAGVVRHAQQQHYSNQQA
jgi:hypothetical protein